MPALKKESLDFIASSRWGPNVERFGALAFLYGTLVSSAIAVLLAVPVSIGIALFISDVAPARLKASATFLMDLLAAVPSVVFGLWGILILAPWIVKIYVRVSVATAGVPVLAGLFRGPANGKSYMTAGLILAVMITPIITSISREVFDTVPTDQKAGAWALGTTRWEMIRGVILPSSRAGVVAAVMLGLGRALGETIAAALVIGSNPQITARLFAPGDSMAAVIANQFGEAGGLHRSALIGLGVLLFTITVVVNVGGRLIVRRTAKGGG